MNKTILCVDDEEMVLSSLQVQLAAYFGNEYDIEMAQSGEDALEIVDELLEEGVELNMVICDYLMPGMTGDEVLIKIHEKLPLTKKILLTGHANLEGLTRIINHGSLYRYVAKPWEPTDLIMTAKEALKCFQGEKALEMHTNHLEQLVAQKTAENQTYLEIVDKYLIASKTDKEGIITDVSTALCEVSGYTKQELIGKNHNILRHPDMPSSLFEELWQTISSGETWEGEVKNRKKDGGYYWTQAKISPTFDDDSQIIGYASIREDITDRKRVEVLSITDEMTNLYNRRKFNGIFEEAVERAKKTGQMIGFTIFDVDFFKRYNDRYGHQKGDQVLTQVAQCAESVLPESESYAFRLGGEEFGLLVCGTDMQSFEGIVENLRACIEDQKIEHEKNKASKYVTASFGGIVFVPDIDASEDDYFKIADDLLYEVKESGRNQVLLKDT